MSPRRRTARSRIVLSVVAVVLAGLMMWMAVLLLREGKGTGQLSGRQAFDVGRTERLAAEIDDRGPFLVPDASPNRRRDIYVQHLGDDEDEGWLAFSAFAPGQTDRECFLRWSADDGVFRDPCDGAEFPSDGDGLEQFPTRVEDDRVVVELE